MIELVSLFNQYGADILLRHSKCLLVLLDREGNLIEQNAPVQELQAHIPKGQSMHLLLIPNSRARFQAVLNDTLTYQSLQQAVLNFATSELHHLPTSYECYFIPLPDGHILMYAEPLPPLDERTIYEHVKITNELAITTRELQKARHELLLRQQALEEAIIKIEQLAYIDELTGLFNRRSIISRLQEEIERVHRYTVDLSVLLIDIDHFKDINDHYGHHTGDQVLRHVAQLQQQSLRKVDFLGRYGGEEFLTVLPSTNLQAAVRVAELLRGHIESSSFETSQSAPIRLTISVGVAQFVPRQDTLETLLSRADDAMYRAKTAGRNRICVADTLEVLS
jgi:diguanylate cyclase (GGDEF)-like protein